MALQAFHTADFMNDELRDSTFGGRISPGAEPRAEKGASHATSSLSSLLLSSLELSDTTIYEPQIRALFGTASHFCQVVVLKLGSVRTHPLVLMRSTMLPIRLFPFVCGPNLHQRLPNASNPPYYFT